jgi:CheY-like chemotaxis protein
MESERILIVEDNPIARMDIQQILESLGYEVPEVISSGEEALRILQLSLSPMKMRV